MVLRALPLFKTIIGRRILQREIGIYRHLQGVEGIPEFKGVVDRDAFAVAFVEGQTLSRHLEPERLRRALVDLESVIEDIHSRNVVHLDLKQKRNVLVRPDGAVAVVDFQSAIAFKDSALLRGFFSFLKKRDRAGLIKFRGKYCPDLLSPDEVKLYRRERFLARFWPFTALTRMIRKMMGFD